MWRTTTRFERRERLGRGRAKDAKNTDGGVVSINQTTKPTPKASPASHCAAFDRAGRSRARNQQCRRIGRDARWSEYGEYMQELIEIVDHEWHGILDESNLHYKANTHVDVTFTINSKGEVKVTSYENFSDDVALSQCRSAITTRGRTESGPTRWWRWLGEEQSITFSFYYY